VLITKTSSQTHHNSQHTTIITLEREKERKIIEKKVKRKTLTCIALHCTAAPPFVPSQPTPHALSLTRPDPLNSPETLSKRVSGFAHGPPFPTLETLQFFAFSSSPSRFGTQFLKSLQLRELF